MVERFEKSHGLEETSVDELRRVFMANRTLTGSELDELYDMSLSGESENLAATPPCPKWAPKWATFGVYASVFTNGKHFVITKSGHMGLVTPRVEVGDQICILPSSQMALIIRPVDEWPTALYYIVDNCVIYERS